MTILDKMAAVVTPTESEDTHRTAHAKARAAADGRDWLGQILDHHEAIEAAFNAVKAAADVDGRRAALTELSILLSAHANAEEAVIYPALVHFGHKDLGMAGYAEQAGAKADLGELEYSDPIGLEFEEKLEQIRRSVAHHVYEEENNRFLDLKKLSAMDQAHLSRRYAEEVQRFSGIDGAFEPAPVNQIQSAHLTRSSS